MDYIKLKDKTKSLTKYAIRVGVALYSLFCVGLLTMLGVLISIIPFPGNLIVWAIYALALSALFSYVFKEFVEYKAEKQAQKLEDEAIKLSRAKTSAMLGGYIK